MSLWTYVVGGVIFAIGVAIAVIFDSWWGVGIQVVGGVALIVTLALEAARGSRL